MEVNSFKKVSLIINEQDSWMLESILCEFLRTRVGTSVEGDDFDKFAAELGKKLKKENVKKI